MNPKITLAAFIVMVIAGIGGWYFGKTSEENRYRVETPTDIEDVEFSAGDEVEVVEKWDDAGFWLVKDDDGHFYNVKTDQLDE